MAASQQSSEGPSAEPHAPRPRCLPLPRSACWPRRFRGVEILDTSAVSLDTSVASGAAGVVATGASAAAPTNATVAAGNASVDAGEASAAASAGRARGPDAVRAAGGVNSPDLWPSAAAAPRLGRRVASDADVNDPASVCPAPDEDAFSPLRAAAASAGDGDAADDAVLACGVPERGRGETLEERARAEAAVVPESDRVGAVGVAARRNAAPLAALPAPRVMSRALAVARTAPTETNVGFVTVRMDRVRQTMRGMGISNAFWTHVWDGHDHRDLIYHELFSQLRPSIVRLRNVHEHDEYSQYNIETDVRFVDSAEYHLGYRPEILLTSWTPPARLKSNRGLMGGEQQGVATLRKDERGWFMYREYAEWWVDSLRRYAEHRLMPTYMSVQNEPDYNPSTHQACVLRPYESFEEAGYYRAAQEVHGAVSRAFPDGAAPAFIGAESYGMEGYALEMPYAGGGVFSAFAGHLYNSSATGRPDDPYSFNDALRRTASIAASKQIGEVWMSEFAFLALHRPKDPLRLAIVVHATLTLSEATVYLHWDGLWPVGAENDEGTMIMVEAMEDRERWRNERGFEVRHSFWWLMHFTRAIRPGYRRVDMDFGVRDVLASGWTGPDGHFAIILVNTAAKPAHVTLRGLPEWVADQTTKVFYSTLTLGYTEAPGELRGAFVSLHPESITSIISYGS